jgi:hypothetical protein
MKRPIAPRAIRAIVLVVQVMCALPAAWHVWLGVVSRRLAAGGNGEEALFAVLGDPVVTLVIRALLSIGLNPSLAASNLIGIGTWLILGAAMILVVRHVGGLLLRVRENAT